MRINHQFEYIARGAESGPRKLVFVLHGYAGDAGLMEKTAAEVAALMPEAMIIMPHGPQECAVPESDDGNMLRVAKFIRNQGSAAPEGSRQWFSLEGDMNQIKDHLTEVADDLNRFIDERRDALGLKDSDIAIMGFSQGGAVALCAAFMRAAAVGCAVGHSTFIPDSPRFTARPPVLYLYGMADEEFPPQHYEDNAQRLRALTDDLTIQTVTGLSHKTSDESRRRVAHYIAARLGTSAPS